MTAHRSGDAISGGPVPAETTVDISTRWLEQEPALPEHCVLHGLPAARKVTFALRSDPKMGSRKKVLVPGYTSVNRAAEYLNQVKIVKAPGWPFCRQCLRRRTTGLALAGVLLAGGFLALVGAFVAGAVGDPPVGVLMLLFFAGFAAMLLAVVPFQRVSLGRLSHAEVTDDGTAVYVTDPSAAFTADLPPAALLPETG
ncbi:hypothetical protein ACWKSP_06470 [Micromonosporaceae bacterium Da 78-11]